MIPIWQAWFQLGGVGGTREQANGRMTVQGRQRLTRVTLTMTLVLLSLMVATGARAAVSGWLGQEQIDQHNSALNTVSCSGPSYCVAGGLDLIVQDHAVRSDLSGQLSPSTAEIAAISCASHSTFCAVTDDSGGAYTLSGEALSARTQVTVNEGFDAVSCPTTSFCAAIDGTGDTFRYSGGTWSPTATLGSLSQDTGDLQVSCVSAQFCIAALPGATNDENYYTYNGTSWSGASVLESTGAVESGLSCTSSTFCVAADTSDNTEKFNGSSWTAPQHHGTGTALDDQFSVSCAGTFCLADSFEDGNTYLTSDGTTWSAGSNLKDPDTGAGSGGPTSCTSSAICVVVDLGGGGNTYALPDTLATQPSLTGSPTTGGTVSLTSGTAANPDTSVVDLLQRCLDGCTPLPGTSYTTTAADDGASIQDAETTGVGLDIKGPFLSNAIGPISSPSAGGSATGLSGGGTTSPPPLVGGTSPHPLAASIGPAKLFGTSVQVMASCPAGSSASCSVKVVLVVSEKLSGGKVIGVTARKRATTRKVTLGTASATLPPGTHRQLTVSLNNAGKRLLEARHTLTADLSVTQNDASPVTRHIELRAPRKKRK
jgi:hypothetical protein